MKLRILLLLALLAAIGITALKTGNRAFSSDPGGESPQETEQQADPAPAAYVAHAASEADPRTDEHATIYPDASRTSAGPSSAPDQESTIGSPDLEAWLASGKLVSELAGEGGQGKQTRIRLVELDFKYPLVRFETTTRAGIATGSAEASVEIKAMVADHLLVSLMPGTNVDQFTEKVESEGFTVRGQLAENTLLVGFAITDGRDDMRYAEERLGDYQGELNIVEPDYIVQAHAQPVNSGLIDSGNLWGLHNTGRGSGLAGADIDALRGWDLRSRAPNTVVAVIDTGLRLTHENLASNLWRNPVEIADGLDNDNNGFVDDIHGYDFYDRDSDPSDLNGHGTHVAGIIGADPAADGGLVGVAWEVQLMALRFLGPRGYGTTSDAIRCIDYARANGAHILNNSWGGAGYSRALEAAIQRSHADGCIFVASAGNSNRDIDVRPNYPAAYSSPNIVSVAATDASDKPAFFTCRGKRKVDIAAPGHNIVSAGHDSDTARRTLSGTSMAAPFVSGILALLNAEFPDSSNSDLINRLYRGAEPLDASYAGFWRTGARANLARALQSTSGRPQNDRRSSAYRSESSSWAAWEVDTAGAVFEPDAGYTPAPGATGDVWFRFTAQSDQALRLSTQESEIELRCHVFDAATQMLRQTIEGRGAAS